MAGADTPSKTDSTSLNQPADSASTPAASSGPLADSTSQTVPLAATNSEASQDGATNVTTNQPSDAGKSSSRLSTQGQLAPPSPHSQPPANDSTSSARSATMTSATTALDTSSGSKEKLREPSSTTATSTLAIPIRKSSKKRERSTSNGQQTSSSLTDHTVSEKVKQVKSKAPSKKSKPSLFTRIAHIFTSCVNPSSRTHVVDLEEGPSHAGEHQKVDSEKPIVAATGVDTTMTEKDQTPSADPSSSTTVLTVPHTLTIVPHPSPIADTEVVVPPTPTKQLLPLDETDGLTSGAVQPPGSTGEESKTEHVHVVVADQGEESDGSYSDDEVFPVSLRQEDLEDEEQRLIKAGGAGIPIGPDGQERPLLPPIAPKHIGRKCLVLDLDETLVHSSLKPVPSPDFIVPVEIEFNWHNFYVLKRPGVDNFLRKMGEIYEVVVFTASLSKYADPVLDRLDPDHTVAHRLFRESCYNHRGNYVKDLSQLGRPIAQTIILDNSPASYIFHPHNAVPVSSWFSDIHDTELNDMVPFLADLSSVDDVRGILNPSA